MTSKKSDDMLPLKNRTGPRKFSKNGPETSKTLAFEETFQRKTAEAFQHIKAHDPCFFIPGPLFFLGSVQVTASISNRRCWWVSSWADWWCMEGSRVMDRAGAKQAWRNTAHAGGHDSDCLQRQCRHYVPKQPGADLYGQSQVRGGDRCCCRR